MASSNKVFEAAAKGASVFPRQIYDGCAAINFKPVFISDIFIIGIIAGCTVSGEKYAHEYPN